MGQCLQDFPPREKYSVPLWREKNDVPAIQKNDRHNQLIAQAREGDEDAIESLTLEDMDTYALLSQRVMKEDIFSIVKSTFMPFGIESDQYTVLGEIIDCVTMEIDLHTKIVWNEVVVQ